MIGLSKATMVDLARKSQPVSPTINATPKQKLTLDISELKSCLIKEFSLDLQDYGIDPKTAVDNLVTIIGMGQAISDKLSFYDVLTFIPVHYRGELENDRERSLKKDCLGLVERFLKNYYQLKYSSDIVLEIQSNWQKTNVGLRTIISYLEQNYGLIPYKSVYNTPTDRNLKFMVKGVVEARNWQVGHPDQYMDSSKYNQEKLIHDSLFVMLYVSSKF